MMQCFGSPQRVEHKNNMNFIVYIFGGLIQIGGMIYCGWQAGKRKDFWLLLAAECILIGQVILWNVKI